MSQYSPYALPKSKYKFYEEEFKKEFGVTTINNQEFYLAYISFRVQLDTLDQMQELNNNMREFKNTMEHFLAFTKK